MSEKCVTCGLVFRTSNELDWHVREEHMKRAMRPPHANGEGEPATDEREPGATAVEPPGRPRWWSAVYRLLGRRPPESPSGPGRGKA
jgi:hypothetical protein